MKKRLISLGIGLNMFFQEYIDLGPPVFIRTYSEFTRSATLHKISMGGHR